MTALGDFSSGDVLTAADLNAIGTWTTYTPTFFSSGGGAAIGNGTIAGRYCKVNELVFVENTITFGSTSTFGTTRFLVSTPVTLAAPLSGYTLINGSGMAFDVSSPQNGYMIVVSHYSTNTSYVMLRTNAATYGEVKYNTPFTFANGDIIQFGYVAKAA
jgi:hypothetical protein